MPRTHRIILKPTPEQQAEFRALLRGLTASVTFQVYGAPGYRVRGWNGTALQAIDLLIRSREDAARLAQELPAHLSLPPVWTALPSGAGVAWAAGYMAVRRHCLPIGGTFIAAKHVNLNALTHKYAPGSADATAFQLGARAYLHAFWAALPARAASTAQAS
ncbi:hypothetical protein [Deinococcus soli (ex Cha et al. 2016)]|uniref:hypothetical protein n=1 Tax=Deinococcus soli (ex Cha et al. 2016) TaxID=1309411 RepID=UPI00166C0BDA|nr:hypothetical protein [Deinococcus soli (ex Cha et al. 2016)]GGB70553.1 hypothetical protein GCM10008019_28420 [Deinococcus soli (ex Cha et al. 2016)]